MTAPGIVPPELRAQVEAWAEQDPDPTTQEQLHRLLAAADAGDAGALEQLSDAFAGRLQFGTAGLRGALGPGPNRMNRVLVSQAAAGLAAYLQDVGLGGGAVIIGFDARYNSDVFARDTAEILAGAGFEALITEAPLPTPVVAFGIRHLGCVAGVVVTASHNPAADNGYKVYLGDGSQIVPPADAEIASHILAVTGRPLTEIPRSDAFTVLGDDLVDAYLERLSWLVPASAPREVSWVYTAMHGVGASLVAAAVNRIGFPPPRVVEAQEHPDPDFPTLSFPNPEEPGAMDLALALAGTTNVDLVIANDPDADRCAVALPLDGSSGQADWRMLRGDELGALLADDALRRGVRGTYACSIVSSSLLSAMAAAHGQPFVYTLTGFKWIGRVPDLAFGYEEAIGYCVDSAAVPDKDGISALVTVLTLAAGLKAEGLTLADRLDEIDRTYGVHATDQLSFRVADLSLIGDAMARLRQAPPSELLGAPVSVIDLATGSAELPPTDGIRLLGDAVTVVVRPSGTEPKLKCYLEARVPVAQSQDLVAARDEARLTLDQLGAEITAVLGLNGA
ncbi:MAG: phospho-sugar mutase [Propionibacteriaceae bacterium]